MCLGLRLSSISSVTCVCAKKKQMSRSVIWIVNGFVFGASWAAGQELYRLQKSGTKTCTKCLAPVGNNGVWSGEREPRSYSFAYGVNPSEWNYKERLERRRKCYGCRKPLDPTSVVVLDRSWHRKCIKCTACEKAITGPRYYMLNNQIFDQPCFHQARRNPRLQRSHTAIIDLRYPSPLTSEDLDSTNSSQLPSTQITSNNEQNKSRLPNILPSHSHGPPKLTRNYSISSNRDLTLSDEPGKMSQEMKRKLANDLLSTLTTLRIREWRKRSAASTFNQMESLKEMNTVDEEDDEKNPLPQQKESSNTRSSFTDNK